MVPACLTTKESNRRLYQSSKGNSHTPLDNIYEPSIQLDKYNYFLVKSATFSIFFPSVFSFRRENIHLKKIRLMMKMANVSLFYDAFSFGFALLSVSLPLERTRLHYYLMGPPSAL
jgi:hypothetical protein